MDIKILYEIDLLTIPQIARRLMVSRQAIHERLVRAGVSVRNRRRARKTLDRDLLSKLYVSECQPVYKIAKSMNTSYSMIYRELDRYEIPRRPRGVNRRKFRELQNLMIGESVFIRRPIRPKPHSSLYGAAAIRGIKISIRRVDAEIVRVTRLR